ncbi:FKBP-type peptidyl-prolyl cis-trans isomerase [Taibaiella koreensis]|uniref:FKBP-type peptidyl-prolyl cis-trans isomerase n=1 Tax=Taibaiella koreensis TaxID=1268548 RepID=UPI000E59B29F|nr:FKBP-type peptidyl-prolyl cis-trans isomerase [Taibaiella koreensis]
MKYASLLLAAGALFCATTGNAQVKKKPVAKKPATTGARKSFKAVPVIGGFTKGPDNLEYKVITHGKGLLNPKEGDVVELIIKQKIDDSLMMNSQVANMGKPVQIPVQRSAIRGDLMSGIPLMREGDSTIFRVRLDTIAARAHQPKPEWTAKNAYVIWEVKLVKIKGKAEVQAEMAKAQEAAAAQTKVQAATDDKLIQEYLAKKGIANAKKTTSGLYYVIHKEGAGPLAAAGKNVSVNYTGVNMDGEAFDSSVDSAFNHVAPIEFPLGQHNVIAGWDEGIALMNKGAKATLYIPSGLAYGPQARGPKIPANAILIFDVELVDIKD